MFLRLNLKDIMENATDGSLVKVASLRLYTDKAGVALKICNIGEHGDELKSDWKTVSYNTVSAAPSVGCITGKENILRFKIEKMKCNKMCHYTSCNYRENYFSWLISLLICSL